MRTADPWAALADPTRRSLLAQVSREPCSVTDLARDLPISRPAVSQHLKLLLDARLVEVQPRGRRRMYVARPGGLAALRAELDTFWSDSLQRSEDLAEATHAEPA